MLERLILLTGAVERPILTALLQRHSPHLFIRAAASLSDIESLTEVELGRARLVGFLTPVIVPARILDALGFGAYNFHPGPPEYPGWLPSHFAVYDRATRFGATAHAMAPRVDEGCIVGVERFAVPPRATIQSLEQAAFVASARLFWRLAQALATQEEALDTLPVKWSGRKSNRRMYAAACDIPIDIDAAELDRRIAAFGTGAFGMSPTILLHGHRFRYVDGGEGANAQNRPAPLAAKETTPPRRVSGRMALA